MSYSEPTENVKTIIKTVTQPVLNQEYINIPAKVSVDNLCFTKSSLLIWIFVITFGTIILWNLSLRVFAWISMFWRRANRPQRQSDDQRGGRDRDDRSRSNWNNNGNNNNTQTRQRTSQDYDRNYNDFRR